MTVEAEIGVMCKQAQKMLGAAVGGKSKEGYSPGNFQGNKALLTL